MKEWLQKNKYIIWYAACFAFLGLIDQRRGSAEGSVQMMFANLTGPAVAAMLIPSMKKEFWKWKGFQIEATCSAAIGIAVCFLGEHYWLYPTQWYTGVLNGVLISVLLLYVVWDWKEIRQQKDLNWRCFGIVTGMLLLMWLSVNSALWPLWFWGLFGCFYLIGIPKKLEKSFFLGMLYGLLGWFFVLQTLAFAFRPYDYVRYKGFYRQETVSGLFYMTAFCAFLCLWLKRKEEKTSPWIRRICYILLAGCVSFVILTGSRSSLIGAVAAGVVGLMGYDILFRKSFRHWLVQGIALGLCALLLFPGVYGAVRYLPTILHHPVWFEGEYNAETSVHSYDPWDSSRYVTFGEVFYVDVRRILQIFGIELIQDKGEWEIITPFSIRSQAAEPGDSPENPFLVDPMYENLDATGAVNIRKTIYIYTLKHLNFAGHESGQFGFWASSSRYFDGHAHNLFLQIAYSFGMIPGAAFLLWNLCCMVRLLRRQDLQGLFAAVFVTAFLAFGCTELLLTPGQIGLTLLFLLYYFGMKSETNTEYLESERKVTCNEI